MKCCSVEECVKNRCVVYSSGSYSSQQKPQASLQAERRVRYERTPLVTWEGDPLPSSMDPCLLDHCPRKEQFLKVRTFYCMHFCTFSSDMYVLLIKPHSNIPACIWLSLKIYLGSVPDEDTALPEISLLVDKLQVKKILLRRAVGQRVGALPHSRGHAGKWVRLSWVSSGFLCDLRLYSVSTDPHLNPLSPQ